MFDQTMSLLLSGEFICQTRFPEAYRYLSDEGHFKDAHAYLARIGRTLVMTELGGAWYSAYERVGPEEKKAMKEEFTRVKQKIRFLVDFFVKAMRASGSEIFYSRGDKIEAHALMGAIDANPALRAEFQTIGSAWRTTNSDSKLKSSLDRHLRMLVEDGYLINVNSEREIYVVTGKIEYLAEVVQFLMATDGIASDIDEDQAPMPTLF